MNTLTALIKAGLSDAAKLPSLLCKMSPQAKKCIRAVGENLEKVEWLRGAFSSVLDSTIGVHLGPKDLFDSLTTEGLDVICSAVDAVKNVDADKIIASLTKIIDIYRMLDVPLLKQKLPKIHNVLTSPACSGLLAGAADKLKATLSGSKAGQIKSIAEFACSALSNSLCLTQLSDGIDSICELRSVVGKGVIKTLTTVTIPQVCHIADEVLIDFSLDNIFAKLPEVLNLLEEFGSKGGALFADFLPPAPTKQCKAHLLTVASEVGSIVASGSYEQLPQKLCRDWKAPLACVSTLGDSLEKVDFIKNHIACDSCGGKSFLRHFVENSLQDACTILDETFEEGSTKVSPEKLVDALPEFLEWLQNVRTTLPAFAKPFLPDISSEACPASQIDRLSAIFADAFKDAGKIPTLFCDSNAGLSSADKACLVSIVDSFTSVPWASTIFKSPDTIKAVVGSALDDACNLFESFNGGDLDAATILEYVPDAITFLQTLRRSLPAFLQRYIPAIPVSCNGAYTRMTDAVMDGLSGKVSHIDSAKSICGMSVKDRNCIRTLSAAIDDVDIIREHTKGLVGMVAPLVDAGCDILKAESNTDKIVAQHMPIIVEFGTKLLPQLSGVCKEDLAGVALLMQEEAAINAEHLCSIDESCQADLVNNLRSISFLKDVIPQGFEVLLQASCPLLGSDSNPTQYLMQPEFFDKLPILLRVSSDLSIALSKESVSAECNAVFHKMGTNPRAGEPGSWKDILPCNLKSHPTCMEGLIKSFAFMPVVGSKVNALLSEHESIVKNILSVFMLFPCSTSAPTSTPNGQVGTSSPTFQTIFAVAPPTEAPIAGKSCSDIRSFLPCIREKEVSCIWKKFKCQPRPTKSPTSPTPKPTTRSPTTPSCTVHKSSRQCDREEMLDCVWRSRKCIERPPTSSPTLFPTKSPTVASCAMHKGLFACVRYKEIDCVWKGRKCIERPPTASPTLFPTKSPTVASCAMHKGRFACIRYKEIDCMWKNRKCAERPPATLFPTKSPTVASCAMHKFRSRCLGEKQFDCAWKQRKCILKPTKSPTATPVCGEFSRYVCRSKQMRGFCIWKNSNLGCINLECESISSFSSCIYNRCAWDRKAKSCYSK